MPETFRFLYSVFGLFVGSGFMVAGLSLFLHGVLPSTRQSVIRVGPLEFRGSAPGLAFAFLGAAIIYLTRFQ
jgi:hypothetical protein